MNLRHLVGADLNLLLTFDAIWRERSMTRAATWLRVTQPAVSHALVRLRTLADDPLFVKGGTGMVPTPRAQTIAPLVEEALKAALAALARPDAFDPGKVSAVIRIGLTDYATAVILPPVLRAARRAAPGLEIRGIAIDTRDPLADLDGDVVDLAFAPLSSAPERFAMEPVLTEELVCVAADTGDLPDEMDLDFYLSRPHLVIGYTGQVSSWADERLHALGKERAVALLLPHGLAVGEAMRGTDLITTVVEGVARRIAGDIGARIYPHPLERRTLVTWQLWHRRWDKDPLHAWFRGLVTQVHRD